MQGKCYGFDLAHTESPSGQFWLRGVLQRFRRGRYRPPSMFTELLSTRQRQKLSTNTHYFCIHVYFKIIKFFRAISLVFTLLPLLCSTLGLLTVNAWGVDMFVFAPS